MILLPAVRYADTVRTCSWCTHDIEVGMKYYGVPGGADHADCYLIRRKDEIVQADRNLIQMRREQLAQS